jgi:hypothetical protein
MLGPTPNEWMRGLLHAISLAIDTPSGVSTSGMIFMVPGRMPLSRSSSVIRAATAWICVADSVRGW